MLMITFSPISTRPSMVAEPICGSSVTLPALASRTSFGLTAGSFSKTSRPAPAISPGSMLPLLCHKRIGVVGLFWRVQQGHRSRLLANSTVSLRRIVAIEFAT